MKKIITIALLLVFGTLQAQKIKLKKGDVLLDGNVIMTYEKEVWGVHKITLTSLENEKDLVEINMNDNETSEYYEDDYVQIKFLSTGDLVEMKMNKSFKKIIEWLVKKKMITSDGKINEKDLPLFVKNYDENITNRTVRY